MRIIPRGLRVAMAAITAITFAVAKVMTITARAVMTGGGPVAAMSLEWDMAAWIESEKTQETVRRIEEFFGL